MVELIDLFDPATPRIKIEVDENLSLTDAAAEFFKRYTKARNAAVEIQKRIETLEREILRINSERERLEVAINAKDEHYFEADEAVEDRAKRPSTKKADFSGARRFRSSDGFEILVGKKAVDNDQLTFRVAGPLDLWLHAADYAGSHVIVRNPNRSDIPHKTLIEAASLAAFYSSGKSQTKAAVHYTQKKFVNKPRGAKPGLVRLASFKTVLVQPEIPAALDQNEGRKTV
jgi:predicted ribosome quality control (RQC) complex YloA/Tae2 family protein